MGVWIFFGYSCYNFFFGISTQEIVEINSLSLAEDHITSSLTAQHIEINFSIRATAPNPSPPLPFPPLTQH